MMTWWSPSCRFVEWPVTHRRWPGRTSGRNCKADGIAITAIIMLRPIPSAKCTASKLGSVGPENIGGHSRRIGIHAEIVLRHVDACQPAGGVLLNLLNQTRSRIFSRFGDPVGILSDQISGIFQVISVVTLNRPLHGSCCQANLSSPA